MNINKLKQELIKQKESNFKGNIYYYSQVNFSYNSNKIEGSKLTSDQTEAIYTTSSFIPKNDNEIKLDDLIESKNHFKLFDYMLDNIDTPLSIDMLLKMHKILKRNTIKEFISVNIKNIDINKFGWIDKLSKLIPGYSKKEIIHVLELDFQYILNNAKLNNIKPENKQVWVYNEFECKRIKIDKLSSYLNNGYFRGRKKF